MIKKIMHILMLSCRKATELVEKKMAFGLSSVEKMQLKMHTSMCEYCRAYEKQSENIDKMFKMHIHPDETPPLMKIEEIDTAKLKIRIIEHIGKK